jgi:hypothetical protein
VTGAGCLAWSKIAKLIDRNVISLFTDCSIKIGNLNQI